MEDAGVYDFQAEEEAAFQLVDQHRKADRVGIHEMHCCWWVVVGMDGHWQQVKGRRLLRRSGRSRQRSNWPAVGRVW